MELHNVVIPLDLRLVDVLPGETAVDPGYPPRAAKGEAHEEAFDSCAAITRTEGLRAKHPVHRNFGRAATAAASFLKQRSYGFR